MSFFRFTVIAALFALSACGQGFQAAAISQSNEDSTGIPNSPPVEDQSLGICSRLDFSGVAWPEQFTFNDRRAMALALNITGSFEGNAGWANIANNFDGQGISLGLSQQNLGQGSLQPLLIEMLRSKSTVMRDLFSPTNFASLAEMLSTWSGGSLSKTSPNSRKAESMPLFPEEVSSPLDKPAPGILETQALSSANSLSVEWATATLFQDAGITFKADWKKSFVNLAVTPGYRSIQVKAATEMFNRAVGYFDAFELKELRSLLVMYDFVVQNGSLSSAHLAQYRNFISANPSATETAKLLKILEIRLPNVRDEFKADVEARKKAIILGTGRVHGTNRDLQKEFCYGAAEAL